jgi:hypothetical protein
MWLHSVGEQGIPGVMAHLPTLRFVDAGYERI